MKRIISFVLSLTILLCLAACGDTGAPQPEGLKVGFGRENVIPDQTGVQIAGGDASARLSTGFLDPVAVTCVAITEGEETILLYTVDFITVDVNVYAAQDAVSKATGIPVSNILLNATHTHSGVSIRSKWDGVDAYRAMYQKAAVKAAETALADQSPAEMYFGSTQTENMVFVRHYLMLDGSTYGNGHGNEKAGIKEHLYPSDGELQVIRFARGAEDKKDIILMNLGAHATINNALAPDSISADWPGACRAYVEANSDSLCAVFEAAAGDQIPNTKIPGLCEYGNTHPDYGNKIGEYCLSVLNGEMTKAPGTGIKLKVHEYTAATMKEGLEDPQQLIHAKELMSMASQMGGYNRPEITAKVQEYGFDNYLQASGLVGRANYPETYTVELYTMTVDGVSFIFAPFEMFGVTGREIKDNSPFDMTFVITCSENPEGHMGYLPHEYACEEGFYEYDVTKFARGTAEDLAKTYVSLLTDMKNAG